MRPSRLILAALATALFAWFVPINDTPAGTAVVLLAVWLTLLYGWHVFGEAFARRGAPAPRTPHRAEGALHRPSLDEASRQAVGDIVALFEATGVLPPAAIRPEQLHEAVADLGAPVSQARVLAALHEAAVYHADVDTSATMSTLTFHASHVEQSRDTLERQMTDLIRLSGGSLVLRDEAIDLQPDAAKALSPRLHVAMARALLAARAPRRLAWLWTDQGVWIAGLSPSALERLNAGPGGQVEGDDGWTWIESSDLGSR